MFAVRLTIGGTLLKAWSAYSCSEPGTDVRLRGGHARRATAITQAGQGCEGAFSPGIPAILAVVVCREPSVDGRDRALGLVVWAFWHLHRAGTGGVTIVIRKPSIIVIALTKPMPPA